jgi:hypothetical protein
VVTKGNFGPNDGVEMVSELIRQSGKIYGIITHSFGGSITARALLDCPRTTNLQKCIFISPDPGGKELILKYFEYLHIPQQVIQKAFQLIESQINMSIEDTSLNNCISQYQEPNKPLILAIHDRDDKEIPFYLIESLFEKNYDSELFITEGLGHYNILRDENVINKILDFMNK